MNIDKKKLMAGAKAAFENRLLEKVEFISTRCWPSNLENNLKDVNRLIEAATVL